MSGDELLGLKEVAKLLGVSKTTALTYAARRELRFPEPVAELGGKGRIWLRSHVANWDVQHRPRSTGRPRKKRNWRAT